MTKYMPFVYDEATSSDYNDSGSQEIRLHPIWQVQFVDKNIISLTVGYQSNIIIITS